MITKVKDCDNCPFMRGEWLEHLEVDHMWCSMNNDYKNDPWFETIDQVKKAKFPTCFLRNESYVVELEKP